MGDHRELQACESGAGALDLLAPGRPRYLIPFKAKATSGRFKYGIQVKGSRRPDLVFSILDYL